MKVILPVQPISQLFPHFSIMGCEGVAAEMLLKYNHIDVSAKTIMNHWPTHQNNPEKGFVGYKYWIKFNVHQTIFPSAFAPYLKQYDADIVDGTGTSLETLESIIAAGQPVILYHTHLGFPPMYRHFNTDEGKKHWVSNIHITLLIGFDENYYYFIDPLWMQKFNLKIPAIFPSNAQILKMSKEKMKKSYDSPGRMCIYKNVEIR